MASDLPFILMIVLPFSGALLVFALRDKGKKAVSYAAVAVGVVTGIVSIMAVSRVHAGEGAFGLLVDGLGYFVALASSVLGALVLVYSLGYMSHEHGQARYYSLVLLTIGSVNGLVLSGNVLVMVGFWIWCSRLTSNLIGFDRESSAATEGARKAAAFGHVGDLALLLGVSLLYLALGEDGLVLNRLTEAVSRSGSSLVAVAAYVFLLAAMVRSAQIPLHVWLPGAMEAPSSASALLDAATVMNAGVYLVMRVYPAFVGVPGWTRSVLWVGAITILASALTALYADDLKRMLAYSTMSQLGYMFTAVGAGSILGAQFHLMSHAIFKTLLFLCAGSVAHAAGTRDMGLLSGVGVRMPATSRAFLVGVMGLSGVPFVGGFFSKDMILAAALSAREYGALVLAAIGAVLTVVYSWSAYLRVFRGTPSPAALSAHEAPFSMRIPLTILVVLTPAYWLVIGVQSGLLGLTLPAQGVHSISPLYLVEETFASTAFLISVAALTVGFAIVSARRRVFARRPK